MKTEYKILGLMSGTSLDGLDLAYCHFVNEDAQWKFEIKETHTVPYDVTMRSGLKNAIVASVEELFVLDRDFGIFLGEQAAGFIKKHNLNPDAIASHGHTIHHRPDLGFTIQIGCGQQLANITGIRTVANFRQMDISLGGQGAPLVPIGDQKFFNKYTFCLNLGGIANVSLFQSGKRIAYDIGIANMLLNHLSGKLDLPYDKNGAIARSGSLDKILFDQLNDLEYYKLAPPKSTGYEWFTSEIQPLIDSSDSPVEDQLHTSVHHIARQIGKQLQHHSTGNQDKLLITGGGALNTFLIEVLNNELGDRIEIAIPSEEIISYKEAMVFAFMGALRLSGEVNVLSSVTGASKDSCSGIVYNPA